MNNLKNKLLCGFASAVIALTLFAFPALSAVGPITPEDVEYLLTKNAKVLPDQDAGIVAELGKALGKFETWGVNVDKVKIPDFEIVFAVTKANFAGPVGVHARVYLVAKHKGTGNLQAFDVEYIQRFGTYSTAVDLINLAKPKASE